jgi:hypothetical protein
MTPRAKFIAEASKNPKKLAAYAWDAMQLASTHDPDHAKSLKDLFRDSVSDFNRIVELEVRISKLEKTLRVYDGKN